MTVLITMAGLGKRFSQEGYTLPKYKINARGRSLFEWSLLSLSNFFDQPFVFACLANEEHEWILSMAKSLGIVDCVIYKRRQVSKGQAETAFDALSLVSLDHSLWIYNIDTYVACSMLPDDMLGFDGCLPVFYSDNPGMSFVRFNQVGEVIEIAEKEVISNWATVGLYGFKSAEVYKRIYIEIYRHSKQVQVRNEQYIAPLFQHMLQVGHRISAPKLDSNKVHVLGTPKEVLEFDSDAIAPIGAKGLRPNLGVGH